MNEKEIEELWDLIYFFVDYIVSKNLRRDFYNYLNKECDNEKLKQKIKQVMYLYENFIKEMKEKFNFYDEFVLRPVK